MSVINVTLAHSMGSFFGTPKIIGTYTLGTDLKLCIRFTLVKMLTMDGALCFQNGHPSNPYCQGVEGVMEAYLRTLSTVQLYGPTNFAPCINHVSK